MNKNITVTAKLDESSVKQLKNIAIKQDRSVSQLIRFAVSNFLKKQK